MQETPNDALNPDELGTQFIALNRAVNWADTPEAWEPALVRMGVFLDKLEAVIQSGEVQAAWPEEAMARLFAILLTVLAEAGQYRHESFSPDRSRQADLERRAMVDSVYIPAMGKLRRKAGEVARAFLAQPLFSSLHTSIEAEVFPLLEAMQLEPTPDRFMPFRVIMVGNIVERLLGFRFRTSDPRLAGDGDKPGLLEAIYQFKYLRFGTSGVRGRWQRDFKEQRAKQVVQAICDYLNNRELPGYIKAEDLHGRKIVIGYDSRLNARRVAEWMAQVCLGNGFQVELANRDTPTPALVYYLTDYLDPEEAACLINCTASHNPPEWQGIKFNPRQGWPAPSNITDFLAARINEIQIGNRAILEKDLAEAEKDGLLKGFDPLDKYVRWILKSGDRNARISLDVERIRKFFSGKKVIVDEMHGAGRGYLTRLLGEIGVQYSVLHPERDPHLPGLDYANPEEPFINPLKERVAETGAVLGLGMDTDADRFGVVDVGGVYFRPNQILPMLVRYLGIDRGLNGRVIATQTGSPLLEVLAGQISGNQPFTPEADVIPAYVDHPFYKRRVGQREDRVYKNTFMVPVGIKYIEEQRRTDRKYKSLSPLPENWRDVILIGGEESSGLTTRGHVTDKDGIWANLLIMDMLAYYGSRSEKPLDTIAAIWTDTCTLPGCWLSYGGREDQGSHAGRSDVDAVLEVKEALINYYLDQFGSGRENQFADLEVAYAGGIRYDLVELQLRDRDGDDRHFLRIRASGTEPINRIYVESSHSSIARLLMQTVLDKLEALTVERIMATESEWRLADMLVFTKFSAGVLQAIRKRVGQSPGWTVENVVSKLRTLLEAEGYLENRNRKMARIWMEKLRSV